MVKFPARKVVLALDAADRVYIKASEKISVIFNQFIDACRVSDIPKTSKGAQIVGTLVRDSFADFVAMGAMGPSGDTTVKNYATGASRAFFHNVEWSAGTHKDPALAVPNPNTGRTRTAGSVKTTNNKALVKTLVKALEQARIMQQDPTAAGIVDLIMELDPEFKEGAE